MVEWDFCQVFFNLRLNCLKNQEKYKIIEMEKLEVEILYDLDFLFNG